MIQHEAGEGLRCGARLCLATAATRQVQPGGVEALALTWRGVNARRYLEQLPPTLFVTELLARGAVQMSKHYIVQCRLGFLTDRQLTKLQVRQAGLCKKGLSH